MAEPILKKYMKNTQAESDPTESITDDNIELSKEFLIGLKNNAYHGMFDEDVVDHIDKILELLDLIKFPSVDSHRLRMKVFPLSPADDARQCKDDMLDKKDNWGIDPFEFISRVNSWKKRRIDHILNNKEWKESEYGNPLNTTTDSFFKAHDERNIKERNELRQMKRKGDNKNDEQPFKRVCEAERLKL
ncbi:hypothetical protein Tco_1567000 [Tanacetum coccineum]